MLRFITLVAITIGLLMPATASAQRRGFGGGRGWDSSQGSMYRGNGSWDNGRSNWNNGGYRGYYGGYTGFGSFGGIYGGYNSSPYGSYDFSGYSSYPGTRNSSGYYDPNVYGASGYQNSNNTINANRARVEVILPDPNAELLIQGQRMELVGRNRIFVSPDLAPGKTFTYTITMRRTITGRSSEDTRKVEVQAGSSTTVDFNIAVIQQTPRPASAREDIAPPLPK